MTCFLGACRRNVDVASRTIDYPLSQSQHAVIVAIDGISASEAKKSAKQRAAQITVSNGDRYFTIDREEEVQVIKPNENMVGPRFYGNMYQELIIEGDFNRERLRYSEEPNAQIYPAIRLVFTSYKDRPSKDAIDACKWTFCSRVD